MLGRRHKTSKDRPVKIAMQWAGERKGKGRDTECVLLLAAAVADTTLVHHCEMQSTGAKN